MKPHHKVRIAVAVLYALAFALTVAGFCVWAIAGKSQFLHELAQMLLPAGAATLLINGLLDLRAFYVSRQHRQFGLEALRKAARALQDQAALAERSLLAARTMTQVKTAVEELARRIRSTWMQHGTDLVNYHLGLYQVTNYDVATELKRLVDQERTAFNVLHHLVDKRIKDENPRENALLVIGLYKSELDHLVGWIDAQLGRKPQS